MSPSILFMLMTLMGSGTDLLDYLPSDDYWKAKGVTAVTVQALLKELEPPKAGADISKLVPDLGAPDFKVRDAAADKIRAMGPAVIPQLRALAGTDNPEVAARARLLISQIGSAGKATQVRRLMAVRTLGEMKAKEALPRLGELTRSDEPFVADYAKAAVAAIDGKPYMRRHEPAGNDAWMLPEECRLVIHMAMRGGKPVDYDAALKAMPMMGPHGDVPPGGAPRPAGAPEMRRQIVDRVIKVADQTGNVRLDGITVGLSGDVGNRSGFVAVIVHGEFDARAVSAVVGDLLSGANRDRVPADGAGPAAPQNAPRPQAKVVDGVEVHGDGREFAFMFPSNRHAILIGGPREAEKPVQKLIAAVKTGKGGLKDAAEMANLIKTIDTKQPVWGAVQMTDAYRQAPVLSAFDTLTLAGKVKGGEDAGPNADIDFRLHATGKDPQQVKDAVAMVNGGIAMAKQQIQRAEKEAAAGGLGPEMAAMGPMIKQIGKALETVQCKADGQAATLTATVNGGMLFSPMMILGGFGMRAEVEVDDGPVEAKLQEAPPPRPALPPQPAPGERRPAPGPTVPDPAPAPDAGG